MRREAFPFRPGGRRQLSPAGTVEIRLLARRGGRGSSWPSARAGMAPSRRPIVERPGSDRPELLVDVKHGFRIGKQAWAGSASSSAADRPFAQIRVPSGSSVDAESDAADVTGPGHSCRGGLRPASTARRGRVTSGPSALQEASPSAPSAAEAKVNSVVGRRDRRQGRWEPTSSPATSSFGRGELGCTRTRSPVTFIGAATRGDVAMSPCRVDSHDGPERGSGSSSTRARRAARRPHKAEVRDERPANRAAGGAACGPCPATSASSA